VLAVFGQPLWVASRLSSGALARVMPKMTRWRFGIQVLRVKLFWRFLRLRTGHRQWIVVRRTGATRSELAGSPGQSALVEQGSGRCPSTSQTPAAGELLDSGKLGDKICASITNGQDFHQ
jgi:hypothetical protein